MLDFTKLQTLLIDGREVAYLADSSGRKLFKKQTGPDLTVPLCFTAVDPGAIVLLNQHGTLESVTFQTSHDGESWYDYVRGTGISMDAGDKIYFRAKADTTSIARSPSNYLQFSTFQSVKRVDVSGNVMSLLAPEFSQMQEVMPYCFYILFDHCNIIRDCSKLILPATTLAQNCYNLMFKNCTSLTAAPALPATTLASYCYSYMFQGCTSLTSAPALPATALADSCYFSMFQSCTSLTSAPALPATALAGECYRYMFSGCTSLMAAPALPATVLEAACYFQMFVNCTNLTDAPALPANDYVYNAYCDMFSCTAVTDISIPNATIDHVLSWQSQQEYTGTLLTTSQVTIHCKDGSRTVQFQYVCFLKGTKITLADSTKKNVEDITYDDKLLVWDFDEGKKAAAPVCWLTIPGLKNDHYYKLTFSDGTVLKTTGQNSNHKVYNVDERFFKGVDKTEVGDRIMSENGIVTVTNKEYIEEEVEYYNIITTHKINCYAEGILASDRYGNMYPVGEDMKYIKNGRPTRPYSEFEAAGIARHWYDELRLGELVDSVEDVKSYIVKLESQMRSR